MGRCTRWWANPTSAILGELTHCAGHAVWLRAKVQAADPDDNDLATTAAPWVIMYGQERDRLLRLCQAAHAMGIETVISTDRRAGSRHSLPVLDCRRGGAKCICTMQHCRHGLSTSGQPS